MWREAILKALAKRGGGDQDVVAALEPIADKLVEMSLAGEISHMKELGDRLEGKAAQQVQIQGDEAQPLSVELSWLKDRGLARGG